MLREQLESCSNQGGFDPNFQGIKRRLFSTVKNWVKRPQPIDAVAKTMLHANEPEPIHNPNAATRLSCQVSYLNRTHGWESGVLAIPYHTWVESSFENCSLETQVFFDLETLYLPQDLGYSRMYANINRPEVLPKQRLGLAVTISNMGQVECWDECLASNLVDYLLKHDRVVSYNGLNFDNLVLSAYATPEQIQQLMSKTFDLYQYLQEIRGFKKRLFQWCREYNGTSNYAKSLIAEGFGYEDGKLIEGFNPFNSIPLILRQGAAAQKRLVWIACFEDVLNTRSLLSEVQFEQRLRDSEF